MKLFKTNSIDHVKYYKHCFSFDMPSELWQKRVKAFESKFNEMKNVYRPNVVKVILLFVCFFIGSLCNLFFVLLLPLLVK